MVHSPVNNPSGLDGRGDSGRTPTEGVWRATEETLSPELMDGGCLLCSEEKPHHCHRRLVAEYLKDRWKDVEIEHIP